jgi:hypothetical protein
VSGNLGWGAWTDYDELVALRGHQLPSEHVGHHVQLGAERVCGGLREDAADGGRRHLSRALLDHREDVAHEGNPAPLPGRAEEDRAITATSPLWLSETTTWTLSRPRARKNRRNFVQNGCD